MPQNALFYGHNKQSTPIACVGVRTIPFSLGSAMPSQYYLLDVAIMGDSTITISNITSPSWLTPVLTSQTNLRFSGTPSSGDSGTNIPVSFDLTNPCGTIHISKTINVTSSCVIVGIPSVTLPNGYVGTPYNVSIALTGTPPYSISSIIAKPTWMTPAIVSNQLSLTGTPDAAGTGIAVNLNIINCAGTNVNFNKTFDVTTGTPPVYYYYNSIEHNCIADCTVALDPIVIASTNPSLDLNKYYKFSDLASPRIFYVTSASVLMGQPPIILNVPYDTCVDACVDYNAIEKLTLSNKETVTGNTINFLSDETWHDAISYPVLFGENRVVPHTAFSGTLIVNCTVTVNSRVEIIINSGTFGNCVGIIGTGVQSFNLGAVTINITDTVLIRLLPGNVCP